MNVDELATELIRLCCGGHSVGMLYRFLLKANNYTAEAARKEFIKFLQGELSERLLEDARRWVEAERAGCRDRAVVGVGGSAGISANGEGQSGVGAAVKLLMFPRPCPADFAPADFAHPAAIRGT